MIGSLESRSEGTGKLLENQSEYRRIGRTNELVTRFRKEGYAPGIVTAMEYTCGWTVHRPPSLLAQKLFWTLLDSAGAELANDSWHTIDVGYAKRQIGSNLTCENLRTISRELLSVLYAYSMYDPDTREIEFDEGVLIDRIQVRGKLSVRGKVDEQAVIRWKAGNLLRETAKSSEFWTIIDRLVVRGLHSRYALALYPYVASRFSLRPHEKGHATFQRRASSTAARG